MTAESPEKTYQKLRDDYAEKVTLAKSKISEVSLLRISVFLVGLLGVYFTAGYTATLVTVVGVIFLASFIAIVIWHSRLHSKKDELARLLQINENEIKALGGDYSSFESGEEFLRDDHPFTGDLDIFGRGSIFQYLNRTSTIIGKKKLGQWFSTPEKNIETIKTRHNAISDLRSRVNWRQQFHAVGIWLHDSEEDIKGIVNWLKMPSEFGGKLLGVLLLIMPVVSSLMLVLLIMGHLSFQWFTVYMFIPLGIAFSQAKKVMRNHELLSKKAEMLDKYGRLMSMIEVEKFDAGSLKLMKDELTKVHQSGVALRKLSKIIQAFDSRLNIFAWIILNYFSLWDLLQARRLEKWRVFYSDHVKEWFEILAHFDALNSLACFWFSRPEFILPQPVDKAFVLEAGDCGHPLLKPVSRIDNPVSFGAWKQFIIVTGANMAGKSTYLRTVAVNFILAMAGAPVCARSYTFSPSEIYTSIRTRDNLLESESYFFAELKRLKAIIDTLESGSKLFIILDEILKGTNSKDKQEGSKALLKQLIRFDASGLIATHDLTLGELVNDYPENIRNNRFEVEIRNDELDFDYKLKEGISQNLNATFLMKKMGITI